MKLNKKGITLIETLLTVIILSIVLIAISIALSSYGGQYKNLTERIKAQEAASLIVEKVELSVRYADTAFISTTSNSLGCNIIVSTHGKLGYVPIGGDVDSPEEYIQSANYNGYNCNAIFTKSSNNSINVKIIIYKGKPTDKGTDSIEDSTHLYSVSRTIKLLNTADAGRDFNAAGKITVNDEMSHIIKYR